MAKAPKGKVVHNKYRRAKIYDYEDVRGVTDNWRSEKRGALLWCGELLYLTACFR